jgi:hypothetical protein
MFILVVELEYKYKTNKFNGIMIVGNIVDCSDEINETQFNCLTMEEFMGMDAVSKLPTLIIGWDNVKKNFGDVSILSKTIYPPTNDGFGGLYWTFSPKEKRGIYEEDLKKFKERCYTDLIESIKTYNIDPIVYNINTTDELCSKIMNLRGGIGYLFQGRIVYVYKDLKLYVIDLELIDFIEFDKHRVIEVLKDTLNVFSEDLEEEFTEELKHLDIKYTPYLKYRDAV